MFMLTYYLSTKAPIILDAFLLVAWMTHQFSLQPFSTGIHEQVWLNPQYHVYNMYKHTNHRGRSSPRALWVYESKALPIDNMCIYAKNIEIILYTYEVEKKFQYGGKKNHFMHSDITGICVEFWIFYMY